MASDGGYRISAPYMFVFFATIPLSFSKLAYVNTNSIRMSVATPPPIFPPRSCQTTYGDSNEWKLVPLDFEQAQEGLQQFLDTYVDNQTATFNSHATVQTSFPQGSLGLYKRDTLCAILKYIEKIPGSAFIYSIGTPVEQDEKLVDVIFEKIESTRALQLDLPELKKHQTIWYYEHAYRDTCFLN